MKRLLPLLTVAALQVTAALAADKADNSKTGWVDLFDGKTLAGWVHDSVGKATYEVVDGTIVGTTVEGSPNSFLCSEKQFGDFELEFDVKVDDGLNSGVQIRSRAKTVADVAEKDKGKRNSEAGRIFGPQVEIESSPGQAGYVYGEATGLGWLSTEPQDPKFSHSLMKNGEWNHFRIVARGDTIKTWINGQPAANLTHAGIYQTHPKGFIGLQVHGIKKGTGPFKVAWKNIRIRELPPESK
jgi:hypothetical protein